jgi:hypothetical protein
MYINEVHMVKTTEVKAQLDTHEAVCAERWKETILRIKRIESIMIGFASTLIVFMATIIYKM